MTEFFYRRPSKSGTGNGNENDRLLIPSQEPVQPSNFYLSEESRIVIPTLAEIAQLFQVNPLGFMQTQFEWRKDTLDPWQEDFWGTVGLELQKDHHIDAFAVASGKGAGKTTVAAQGFLWHVAAHEGRSQTLATSITGFHVRSRFWREVMKWYQRWKLRQYFKPQSTRIEHVDQGETWFGSHQTHNPENPEAMFGVHEDFNGFFVDETSAIPDVVLEAIEGNATGPRNFILYISNASRSVGRFRECFRRNKARWVTWQIDTRSDKCTRVTEEYIDRQLEEANGDEDANSFKRDVRAEFPSQDAEQVIPPWLIEKACEREAVEQDTWTPITIGVDIARTGYNKSVFVVRQGAFIREVWTYGEQSLEETASRLMDLIDRWRRYHTTVYVDADGWGIEVYDRCIASGYKSEMGYNIVKVRSGARAFRDERYHNRRAELWYECRRWLQEEACLNMNEKYFDALQEQLTNIYYHNDVYDRRVIESKESMHARGVVSPDIADALVYSCFNRIIPRAQMIALRY